ncbi:MAG: YbaN family protein, partial [Paludibacteraceae bacterium]|nr:YbaN family protein [Paludibacteraceae bacterium]
MKLKKVIYIVCGVLCVILGTIGVVVPGIPTTPFVLLASWLFYRSSERLRNWLLSSRLGKYAREYERNKGLTVKGKISAIAMMTIMCTISVVFFIPVFWVKILVAVLGL